MEKPQRLESLDILRGFDLFCLVALEPVLRRVAQAVSLPWFDKFMLNFSHVEWEGFAAWDLVMPLFLFMSGVSMPFAFSRYKPFSGQPAVYGRVLKGCFYSGYSE